MSNSLSVNKQLFITQKHWSDLQNDLTFLKSCDESDLDVTATADSKGFHLEKISFWDKIAEIFSSSLKQTRLDRLKNYAQRTHDVFAKYSWKFNEKQIEEFYTHGLAKWDRTTFNRSILSQKVKNILSKDLRIAQKTSKRHELPIVQEAQIQAGLALKLGIKPKKNSKGVNGSIIYLDIHGKPIGIFKAENPPKGWLKWFRQLYLSLTPSFIRDRFFLRTQSDLCHHDQTHAEIAASFADDFFRIGLIPLTRRVTLEGKSGSFMLWQHQMKEAAEFQFSAKPSREELFLFQKMVIYDYLLGNLDRHLENWLLGVTKMEKLNRIAMIDNGNAFPEELPTEKITDYFGRQKIYKWKEHAWSKYPFEARIMSRLRELSPAKINQFIDKLRKKLPGKSDEFFTMKRVDNLRLRASVLYEIGASRKSNFHPSQLGKAYSNSQILSLKNKINPLLPNLKLVKLR